MKKFIACLLAVIMVMSFATVAFATDFTDISRSRYEDAINELYDMGIVNGYSKTKFGTDYTLTRAEACAIMVRALYGEKTVRDVITFDDVAYRDWFYEYVNTAVFYDIVHGHSDKVFAPNDEITFDQMTTIILNALGYNAPELAGTWPENVRRIANRLDLYDNVPYYIDGSDAITRGEACQMLYNALDCYVVEYVRGKIVETDETLYEKMGFFYDDDNNDDTKPVKPVNPSVKDNQIFGIVEFVEEYTFGENHEYTGYEIKFYDNDKVYKTGGTKVDGVDANLGRGDYVWLELTYSNSDTYKIAKVIHFADFQPGTEPDDIVFPPVVTGDDEVVVPVNPPIVVY